MKLVVTCSLLPALMMTCTAVCAAQLGAYYTKLDSGEDFEKTSRTNQHADVVVSVGDGGPQPLKESRFTHATLEEEDWDPNTQGVSEPMFLDPVNQEMDFFKDGADPGMQGDWDLTDVSSYMGDGDVWTISFDFRIDSRVDPVIGEIIMALGQGTCYEEPGPGDAPDRMVKLLFDEDDPGFWRFVTTSQGDNNDAVTNGLPFDIWFHCDIVFNKSGSTLVDYYGGENLSDNNADFWLDGQLAIWEYALTPEEGGRGMVEEDPISKLCLRVDKNQEGWASYDNFAVYDRVVVDTTVVEDITEGTPVAGMLGLGLIPAACAFGGTLAIRRKK